MDTSVTTIKTIYWNYWFRGVMSLHRPAASRRGWEVPGLHVWRAVTFMFSRMLLKLSLQIPWESQIPFKYLKLCKWNVTLNYLEITQTQGAVKLSVFWSERGKAVNVFWAAAQGHEGHWSQLSLRVKDRNTGHQSITAHIIYSHSQWGQISKTG